MRLARLVFIGKKRSPQDRLHAQHIEDTGGCQNGWNALWFPIALQVQTAEREGFQMIERLILFSPVQKIRRGDGSVSAGQKGFKDRDQALRMRVRKRFQQHRIDDAEQRGVRADAKRQGQNGHRRETGAFPKSAERETEILQHVYLRRIDNAKVSEWLLRTLLFRWPEFA